MSPCTSSSIWESARMQAQSPQVSFIWLQANRQTFRLVTPGTLAAFFLPLYKRQQSPEAEQTKTSFTKKYNQLCTLELLLKNRPQERGTNPASGQHRTLLTSTFKKFPHCQTKRNFFMRHVSISTSFKQTLIKQDSIYLTWRHITAEMLLICSTLHSRFFLAYLLSSH